MAQTNINLIRPAAAGTSVYDSAIVHQLRLAGWITLGCFLTAGIFAFAVFFLLNSSFQTIKKEEKNVVDQLSDLSRMEGLHTVVSSRLQILSAVIASQPDIETLFSTVSRISSDSGILSIVRDEELGGTVSVKLQSKSLGEANTLVSTLLGLSHTREISDARLASIALDPEGNVTMSISFVPTFKK